MPTTAGLCGVLRCGRGPIELIFTRMADALRGKQPIETAKSDWYCVASCGFNSTGFERGVVASNTDFTVCFEGRIDNRQSILESLSLPKDTTNATLLATGLARSGDAIVMQLIGAFVAVVIRHADRNVSIFNDHLALRHLLFAKDANGHFLFASDPRQLLPALGSDIRINRHKLFEQLSPFYLNDEGWIDFSSTLFSGISRLPHATQLTVSATGTVRMSQYWHPPDTLSRKWSSPDECADEFKFLFTKVLAEQLDTDRKIGAELSGGIDSGCLVSVAADIRRQSGRSSTHFNSYTLSYDKPGLVGEDRYVHAVSERWPEVSPSFIQADELTGLLEFGRYHQFRNLAHPARLNLPEAFVTLAQQAAADGCELLFSGEGADWFLEGSDVVWDSLIRAGKWRELYTRLSIMSSRGRKSTLFRYLTSYALRSLLPFGLSHREFVREYYSATWQSTIPDIFCEAFTRELSHNLKCQIALLQRKPSFQCWSQRLEHELLFPPNHGWQGIPVDVELRLPYLDRRIVEFGLAVPPEYKFVLTKAAKTHYGARKVLQRRAFRDVVPRVVLERQTKATYGIPVLARLANNVGRVFVADDECHLENLGILDLTRLRKVLLQLPSLSDDDRLIPWLDGILGLELWLRALSHEYGSYS